MGDNSSKIMVTSKARTLFSSESRAIAVKMLIDPYVRGCLCHACRKTSHMMTHWVLENIYSREVFLKLHLM